MASEITPALERLPPEVLAMITDSIASLRAVREENTSGIKDLKALRLSCRTFAYLRPLQATLFHTIQLTASPASLRAIESERHLSGLEPFVRRIIFVPWKYSWNMRYGVFKAILLQRCDTLQHDMTRLDESERRQNGAQQLPRLHPMNPHDVERQFTCYEAHAKYSEYIYQSGRFVGEWSHFISSLPNVTEFTVRHWEYDGEDSEADEVNCEFFAHSHESAGHPEWHCRDAQICVGDALFDAVIKSLRQAKTRCNRLDIAHICDGRMSWMSAGLMEGLNLSRLTVLRFRPRSQEFDDLFLDPDEQYRAFALYGRRALDRITRKCSSTLKHLEVAEPGVETQLDFPPKDMVQLPKLESLIVYAAVRLPALANVINNSKNLKELRIHPDLVIHGTWRPVLRAIRHHPNDIEFSCHIRLMTYRFELDRYVRGADIPDRIDESDSTDEEHASLVRYISKKGTWNQHCKAGIGMDIDRELGFESETDGESSDESLEPFENVSDGGSTDLSEFDELF